MRKNTSRTIRIISRVGISGQTVASISTCDSCCDCVTVSLLRIRSLVRHVTDSSPRSGVRDLMSQRTSVCLQALTFPSIKLNFARIFLKTRLVPLARLCKSLHTLTGFVSAETRMRLHSNAFLNLSFLASQLQSQFYNSAQLDLSRG